MKKQLLGFLLGGLLLFVCSIHLTAETIYVKPSAESTAWASQTTVYTDLQDALAAASYGDEIWVAQGTYYPTDDDDRSISFELVNGVSILGGFSGTETSSDDRDWNAYPTILSGDIGVLGDNTDNSYHVMTCTTEVDETTIVNGFVVEKGYANSGLSNNNKGGGLYITLGQPYVINSIFRENFVWNYGGGVYNNGGNIVFANCLFYDNESEYRGGAINVASGTSLFYNCNICNNYARYYGGGIYTYDKANVIINTIVWGNRADSNYDNILSATVLFSCIEDDYTGEGNISEDPLFIDASSGDFRLDASSPCINAGINDSIPDWLTYDFAAATRILEDTVDIGIYESGVICPVLLIPVDNTIYENNDTGNEINFTAGWASGTEPYNITRYFIEYWEVGEDTTVVDISSNLSYSVIFYESAKILWRVGVETASGAINYSQANTLHINHSHPLYVKEGSSGNGTSWNDAFGDLQDALNESVYGDEIWVAQGTYYPTDDDDRTISFELVNGVSILGGFFGNETSSDERDWNAYPTILSGDIGVLGDNIDNSYHVISCTSDVDTLTIIDGLIVEKGYASFSSDGGGMYVTDGGSPVVKNSVFRENYASDDGGAIYSYYANPTFANTMFYNNVAYDAGGAIYSYGSDSELINCVVSENNSNYYGGIYSPNSTFNVINTIVWGNNATYRYDNIYNATVIYSCIEDGYTGEGNISEDPLFIDASAGDFRLDASSPCINAGINDSIPDWLTCDFTAATRILNDTVDMGIYEGGVICPVLLTPDDNFIIANNDSGVEINFTAGWETAEEPDAIIRYFIQFWDEAEDTTTVDISSELNYSTNSFNQIGKYDWRVGVETGAGAVNYSQVSTFYIKHNYPLYVKEGSSGDGASWNSAYGDLQDALDDAIYGDEIWVAEGTYYPTNDDDRETSFELVNGVSLLGGFSGTETSSEDRDWNEYPTILSGDIGTAGVDTDNSYHVMTCATDVDSTTVVNGFIIEKGYAGSSNGGALNVSDGKPVFAYTVFKENYSTSDGGAIYNSSGKIQLLNCKLYNNEAARDGGAIYNNYNGRVELINCIVSQNYAGDDYGGASSNYINSLIRITNSVVWGNVAVDYCNNISNSTVSYSCIEDGYTGEGNISDDPLFMDVSIGDFRLNSTSPCIDAGINDSIPDWLTYDFAKETRILNDTVDMGIYEGGVICPILLSPLNDTIINAESAQSTVEFTAYWESGGEPYAINNYSIQYWEEGGDTITVAISSDLTYSADFFNEGTTYHWRIKVDTEDGYTNYSTVNTFTTNHSYPLYVKEGSTGDGTSWDGAFGDLQDALAEAVYGDEIWVAQGTYYPTSEDDRSFSFELVDGVSMLGGFSGTETSSDERDWNQYPTILSGDIGVLGDNTDNSYHVISCTSNVDTLTIIDGLVIEKGYANSYNYHGGGMYIKDGNPVIKNSVFRENYASDYGGAIYSSYANTIFANTIFYNNVANFQGGAICSYGSDSELINCVVSENNSNYRGGGIYNYNSTFNVINTIVWGNYAASSYDNINNAIFTYSCIEGGYSGDGNISEDPLFIDASSGDFRLKSTSPCINAGINDSIPDWLTYDFSKETRILNDTVDMGIYEGGVICPILVSPGDDAVIDGDFLGATVEFSAGWEANEEPYSISKYIIQYWEEGGDTTTVDITSDLTYSDDSFNDATTYLWRVGVETESGDINYSEVFTFYVNHYGPIYVKEGSSGNGSSWSNAYGDLQDALADAYYGDEIWVAQGTYYPTDDEDRDISFELVNGVSILGGFVGTESSSDDRDWNLYPTILSGDIGTIGTDTDNSYHVVSCTSNVDSTTIVDGCIIEKGYADYNYSSNNRGGGIYVSSGNPVIKNSIFKDNYASYNGGAAYVYSYTEFLNCIFYNNTANDLGGALFSNSISMVNCIISNNIANSNGGGIYSSVTNEVELINSIVYGNTAEYYPNLYSSISCSYSCIEGDHSGTGNISDDPQFVDADNYNFRLLSTSPCIDAGLNDSIPEDLGNDFDNGYRINFGTVDMGAYEAAYPSKSEPTVSSGFVNYEWTLGAHEDGGSSVTGFMETTDYDILLKVWEKDNATNVFEDRELNYLGYYTDNIDNEMGYQWAVGVQVADYIYWSDTSVFYVGHDHPLYVKEGSSGEGTSWSDAYGTVSEALSNAITGDELWVAAGTYYPTSDTNRDSSFVLNSDISIYGGFAGTEGSKTTRNNMTNKTILSGDIGTAADESDNAKQIIKLAGTEESPVEGVVIEGFYIQDGYSSDSNGAGIYSEYADYTLKNCIINSNSAVNGAGVANIASNAYFYNSLFYNNDASGSGGAIYSDDNSSSEIINCTISKNSTGVNGNATIGNTIIYGNTGTAISGNATASYSCVEGGYDGDSNTSYDPAFTDADNFDFTLGEFSSCFNQGSNALLPSDAFADLYYNTMRTEWSIVDIGANEIAYDEWGSVEVSSTTPSSDEGDINYSESIVITFNQPVVIENQESIYLSPEIAITDYSLSDDGLELTLTHNEAFTFDQTYSLNIDADALSYMYNDQIGFTAHTFSFTVRSCINGGVTVISTNDEPCPLTEVTLSANTSGDILSDFIWSSSDSIFTEYSNTSYLELDSFTDEYEGTYTVSASDMCGNTVSDDIDLYMNSNITIPEIKTKWDDVLLVDNSEGLFSDYIWYSDAGNEIGTGQYLTYQSTWDISYVVSAMDEGSGCRVYSDTLAIELSTKSAAITVYPNPVQAASEVTVTFGGEEVSGFISLYNTSGALLFKDEFANSGEYIFNETNLLPGIYLLEVVKDEERTVTKLVITK